MSNKDRIEYLKEVSKMNFKKLLHWGVTPEVYELLWMVNKTIIEQNNQIQRLSEEVEVLQKRVPPDNEELQEIRKMELEKIIREWNRA